AVAAVRHLRALDKKIEITVIGRKAEFVFYPSLIWIPTGLRQGSDLVVSLEPYFRRQNIAFHAGEVTGLAEGGRLVLTSAGSIANDGLIIASGGRFIKTLPGIEHAFIPCEGVAAAEGIRDRIESLDGGTLAFGYAGNPDEPGAVRGSPIFEFLFGIDTHLRRNRRRSQFKLVFFHPSAEPGTGLGEKAVSGLFAEMKRRDIETHLGHPLKAFSAKSVTTDGGEFPADVIVFMPGVTGGAWLDNTSLPRSSGGLLQADATCRVSGCPGVYVAGDVGSFPGPDWLPKLGHMADLQATTAANNLAAELAGREPKETFKAELMCIIDAMDKGTFVMRTLERSMVTPQLKVLHTSKNWFEWYYLRQLR
ncbi:MAG: FAD-dependent oxidoreductase, partial [Rhodocyclaceae bacterium]